MIGPSKYSWNNSLNEYIGLNHMNLSFLESKWSNVSNFVCSTNILPIWRRNMHIKLLLNTVHINSNINVYNFLSLNYRIDFSLLCLPGNTKLSRIISTTAKGWNSGEPSPPEAHFGISIHSGCAKRVPWEYHRWLLKQKSSVETSFHLPQILNGAVF